MDKRSLRTYPPVEERFWPKVDKNGPVPEPHPELGPCWVWTGAKSNTFIQVRGGRTRRICRACARDRTRAAYRRSKAAA